jgi:hypothetical protein
LEPNIGIGYTSSGECLRFFLDDDWLLADDMDLVSLSLPDTIRRIDCMYNYLTHLHIPNGVRHVECEMNDIKELVVPDSVVVLSCDKDLFIYDECKAEKVNIYYWR